MMPQADIIFIGRVTKVAPIQKVRSGTLAVTRRVDYVVETVLYGAVQTRAVEVWHFVVSAQRDARPADTTDPATPYRKDARLLVSAYWTDDPAASSAQRLQEIDNDTGAIELPDTNAGAGPAWAPTGLLASLMQPARLVATAGILGGSGLVALAFGLPDFAIALELAALLAAVLSLSIR